MCDIVRAFWPFFHLTFSFFVLFVNIFVKFLMSKCPNSACNMVKSICNHPELEESVKYLIEMHE